MAVNATQKAAETAGNAEAINLTKKTENQREMDAGKADRARETMIYIGPSLPGHKLKSNKIFIGTKAEIERELAGIIEKYPLVSHLVVPISQLEEKKARTKTPGNILHKYCADILSMIAKQERMG